MNLCPCDHLSLFIPHSDLTVSLGPTLRNPRGDYLQGGIVRETVSVVHDEYQVDSVSVQFPKHPMDAGAFRAGGVHHDRHSMFTLGEITYRRCHIAVNPHLFLMGKHLPKEGRIAQQALPRILCPRGFGRCFRCCDDASDSQRRNGDAYSENQPVEERERSKCYCCSVPKE